MTEAERQEDARARLQRAVDAFSTPEARAELVAHLEAVTEEAARDHELILALSQEVAGNRFFP